MVRRLRRKRLVRPANEGRLLLRPDQEWAIDFACDALATGRGIRSLAIVRVPLDQCAYIKDVFPADLPASIPELDHRSAV